MPVADCGVFEVGERSEVGALESYQAITSAQPTLPLVKRATNMSESE